MKKSLFALLIAAGIVLSLCNLPGSSPSESSMMTAAAMTVQAVLATTPLASPTAAPNTPLPSPTSSAPPFISVGEVTNCRSGPSQDYERVTQIQPGQEVQIIGFYPPNYWVVNSQAGNCWISAEFATPSGSYQTVPTVTAPPTPDGNAPKAPSFPKNGWSYVCPSLGQIEVTFNWNDNADNETGYRIYRNDEVIAELPANSRTFSESVTTQPGQSITYRIEVYNLLGTASAPLVTITC